jgi:hypothetical protein
MARSVQLEDNLRALTSDPYTKQYKVLPITSVAVSEVTSTANVSIINTDTLSSNVCFARAIHKSYGTTNLPANATFTYKGNLTVSPTGSVSALYELIRGYLYRVSDSGWHGYLSGAASSYIISQSTTANPPCLLPIINASNISAHIGSVSAFGAITGVRFVMFDNNIKLDRIKPTSFRMSVTPVDKTLSTAYGLVFSNSSITDNVTTGYYASVTGMESLTGSLSSGSSGTLTAFTIRIRCKPENLGSSIQTLFHRRVADKSLSSLGAGEATGINNKIVMYHYGNLNPVNLEISVSSVSAGSSTLRYLGTTGFGTSYTSVGALSTGLLGLSGYVSSIDASLSPYSAKHRMLMLGINNIGGGKLRFAIVDNGIVSEKNYVGGSWEDITSTSTSSFIMFITGSTTSRVMADYSRFTAHSTDNLTGNRYTISAMFNYPNTISSETVADWSLATAGHMIRKLRIMQDTVSALDTKTQIIDIPISLYLESI